MTELWRNESYDAPVDFVFDRTITEYDISKANISALMQANQITKEEYNYFYSLEKRRREIEVGLKCANDPKLNNVISAVISEARGILCRELGLEDENILHIAKDAIFVISRLSGGMKLPEEVQVGEYVKFRKKSTSTSYVRFNRKIMFYHDYDIVHEQGFYKIRGMSQDFQNLHKDFFIQALMDIMNTRVYAGSREAYEKCKQWYANLGSGDIRFINYLRRFDVETGCFDITNKFKSWKIGFDKNSVTKDFLANLPYQLPKMPYDGFLAAYVDPSMIPYIDPSYNQNIIATLGNYILIEMINGGRR